ncbi:MAG TPA: acylphosphatase [Gemmatimonadetes bacterium]|nr:acylphosphatase [Gemmatimonadota bacterium]
MYLNVPLRAYRVTGRVQGVGFRWFTSRAAKELGISGTVQNHPDGSVRVHARGALAVLDQLEATITRGPMAARVEAVERVEPSQTVKADGFRIERA